MFKYNWENQWVGFGLICPTHIKCKGGYKLCPKLIYRI
nr:MAG TPA: hypothetical protein [Caudoviricetes sp.]DAL11433.1 MAG TPA_asm: hypothetical protein [Caudoviricetes sp.]